MVVVDDQREKERRRAWRAYLRSTKRLAGEKYDDVEPHAWTLLQQQLAKIESRRLAA